MLRIGLTYDMKTDYASSGLSQEEIAEFDSEETVAGLEAAIAGCGHTTDRIGNIRSLTARLAAGETWDFVFNIAEGLAGPGRESQVPCLLEAWNIPYSFSDPMVLALCLHKAMTKRVIRDAALPTADFAVLDSAAQAAGLALPYPLFAKPVAEGTGKGISAASKIENPSELARVAAALLEKFHQPVLVETFLPGREFTAGLTGTGEAARLAGCMEIHYGEDAEGEVYSYANKAGYEQRISYTPGGDAAARAASALALAAYRLLGCRDGGRVDIRCDAAGAPHFIEINPLAGLNPVHSDLPIAARLSGVSYNELIRRILESAFKRAGLA
ncbi:MAG: D-alanine--D-alanine ligase [Spirochaetales bacterium]|jgi:D-alanine-D-alanine ligase|nr:D-alanine--D-alanine ligase [Spirochaetales bacterium]